MKSLLFVFAIVVMAFSTAACGDGQPVRVMEAMVTQETGSKPFASQLTGIGDTSNHTIFASCVQGKVVITLTDKTKWNTSNVIVGQLTLGNDAICGVELQKFQALAYELYHLDPAGQARAEKLGFNWEKVEQFKPGTQQ